MASIRKRNGVNGTTYHVQIRRKGLKPITQSFSNRTLALQWARQTESALERSEYLDLAEAKTTFLSEASIVMAVEKISGGFPVVS